MTVLDAESGEAKDSFSQFLPLAADRFQVGFPVFHVVHAAMPHTKALAASMFALALMGASVCARDASASPAASGMPSTPARRLQTALGVRPDAAWVLKQETATELIWLTPQKLLVSVQASPLDKSIVEAFSGLAATQEYFRRQAGMLHGGLVEAVILQGRPRYYGLVTIKIPLADASRSGAQGGTRYVHDIGALFPFADGIGLLDVTGEEGSAAEARAMLVSGGPARTGSNTRPHDPQDSRYDAGALYIDADARTWDGSAPEHPLSRARALMTRLLEVAPLADGVRRE